MSYPPLRKVCAVGSTAIDVVYVHPELEGLGDFKAQAEHTYIQAGGGGANFAIAMRELRRALGNRNDIVLFTKIGNPREGDKLAGLTKTLALEELHGINLIDAVLDCTHTIPFNSPVAYSGGRFISTRFTESVSEFEPRVGKHVASEVPGSDILFIHSRYPRLSLMAAKIARANNIPILFDYSVDKPGNNALYHELLRISTHVVAPGEARVSGMEQDDPARLRDLIVNEYGVPNVAVSNGTDPVLVYTDGAYHEIPVPRAAKVVDALGVGDLRNAMTITEMLRGGDFLAGIRKGTALATFSVGYPGREWTRDVSGFMRGHPLFAGDLPPAPAAAHPPAPT